MNSQVLTGRVVHIDYSSPHHEQYYKVTEKVAEPKPVSKREGKTVYNYMPLSSADCVSFSSDLCLLHY